MDKIKKHKSTETSPFIETKDTSALSRKSGGNLYRAISIIGKRSNQIAQELKEELHGKLEEFASTSDNLEEVFENREQIEISRFYERLPHPTLLASQEYIEDQVYVRDPQREEDPTNEK